MKTLHQHINEKLIINKNFKNVSFNDSSFPAEFLQLYFIWNENHRPYKKDDNLDIDNWYRRLDINSVTISEFKADGNECKVKWDTTSNGFNGEMKIGPQKTYIYKYEVTGQNTQYSRQVHQLNIILNYTPNIYNGMKKLLKLYNENRITHKNGYKLTWAYSEFKLNSNDILEMFDIVFSDKNVNKKFNGNYTLKLYDSHETYLKKLVNQ